MGSEKPQKTTTFLVVRDGVKPDWVAIWDTVEITVGRHESQDISVREAEVSRKHCVFRQKGGVYTLEDLGSAIGTTVNGTPIKVHELKSGDVVAVGSLRIKFGQTASPVKPGANVRFASQLKGFTMPGARANAEGGLTMMAIDLNDSMRGGQPAPSKPALKPLAVSLDGRLEEAEAQDLGDSISGLAGLPPSAISTRRSPTSTTGSRRPRSRLPPRRDRRLPRRARRSRRRSPPRCRAPRRPATCACSSCSRSRGRRSRSRRSWPRCARSRSRSIRSRYA